MKLQELTIDEKHSIYGGSEASDAFCYLLGAGYKATYYVFVYPYVYGYNYIVNGKP